MLFFSGRVSTSAPYHTRSFAPSLLVFLVYSTGYAQIEVTAVSVVRRVWKLLRGRVATINAEFSTGHVAGGVGEEEGDSAHEVFGLAHLALRDEGDPLLGELGVLVEDLLCAVKREMVSGLLWLRCWANETYSAVSMYPGEMQLTRTPACAHSTASEDAMCLTAALAAL